METADQKKKEKKGGQNNNISKKCALLKATEFTIKIKSKISHHNLQLTEEHLLPSRRRSAQTKMFFTPMQSLPLFAKISIQKLLQPAYILLATAPSHFHLPK